MSVAEGTGPDRSQAVVREATIADAGRIARVQVDSYRTTYQGVLPSEYLGSLSCKERTDYWHDYLSGTKEGRFAYVAEENHRSLVGFAAGGPELCDGVLYTGRLGSIYLLETRQRLGIGRRLVAAVADRLVREGHSSMLGWVLRSSPARLFYEALGGVEAAESEITVGGVTLPTVAYGWCDVGALVCASGR
jgi:GNAT superfamily N-acetyltransferase